MIMNPDIKYLFWFEAKQDDAIISDLKLKLNNLGVSAEIINGVQKPAIIQFGNRPSQVPAKPLGMVKQ